MVKRKPKLKFEESWLGKRATNFIDRLEPQQIGKAAKHAAIILPFVLAERKVGGLGLFGVATGALADRLIEEKVDLPVISVFGSSVQVNAGYSMLAGVLAFLGLNGLYYGVGVLKDAADLAGKGALDAMIAHEKAQKQYFAGEISAETYQQSKAWKK